jgi:hypothetical protein
MTIYLYVKTHSKTGLKYLGKTTKDPYTYHGSGVDWKAHLKEHGSEHTTEIIKECQSNQELTNWGRYYSEMWNVAESKEWANRIPETGGGANHTDERKELFRQQQLGRKKPPRTKEHTEKIAVQARGKSNPKTAEGLRKWYDSNPDRSKAIEKQSKSIQEWYINNPGMSHTKALKTWDGIYKKDYEKYKMAVSFIAEGKTNREITKLMKIDYATCNKLRSKSHRVFELFPEFKQLMSTEVL